MSQPKDYDSTVARIAGNIAAGLIARCYLDGDGCWRAKEGGRAMDLVVVELAEQIVQNCRDLAARQRGETEP